MPVMACASSSHALAASRWLRLCTCTWSGVQLGLTCCSDFGVSLLALHGSMVSGNEGDAGFLCRCVGLLRCSQVSLKLSRIQLQTQGQTLPCELLAAQSVVATGPPSVRSWSL